MNKFNLNNTWGDYQEYKSIKLYPVKLKYLYEFYDYVNCLMFDKNKIPDIRVIKMSYLDFLFSVIASDTQWYQRLNGLLDLVLYDQKHSFSYSQHGNIYLHVNDEIFNGNDFDNIKKIILVQNSIPFNDETLDPELEKALKEAEEFMSSKNNSNATIEERIISLHCISGIPFNEIKEYTIYQFNKVLERHAVIKNYEVFSPLIAQYGKSEDIQHWLCHIEEKGKYGDLIISQEEFNKIANEITK